MSSDLLVLNSPAKINLTLRILGTRPDGYHDIESLVARINLADRVTVNLRDDSQIRVSCDNPLIPTDSRNLAHKAAAALMAQTGARFGADISIEKRIPVGAGLGGGSSNAATVMTALNRLWLTGLSIEELAIVGARVGSDVPLFFHSPVCLITGRGECVVDITAVLRHHVALIMPTIDMPTKDVYAAWDQLAPPISSGLELLPYDASFFSALLRDVNIVDWLSSNWPNELEPAACAVNAEFRSVLQLAHDHFSGVRMTGSGSTLFRLFESRSRASTFAETMRDMTGAHVEVTQFADE